MRRDAIGTHVPTLVVLTIWIVSDNSFYPAEPVDTYRKIFISSDSAVLYIVNTIGEVCTDWLLKPLYCTALTGCWKNAKVKSYCTDYINRFFHGSFASTQLVELAG